MDEAQRKLKEEQPQQEQQQGGDGSVPPGTVPLFDVNLQGKWEVTFDKVRAPRTPSAPVPPPTARPNRRS